MKLEASPIGKEGVGMAQIPDQLANLMLQVHDIKKGKDVREEIWCLKCKAEGHHKDQCPLFQDYLSSGAPNPLNQGAGPWCEICQTRGSHRLEHFPLLQKYVSTLTSLYCNFCKSVGHDGSNSHAYDMMHDQRAYRVQGDEPEG